MGGFAGVLSKATKAIKGAIAGGSGAKAPMKDEEEDRASYKRGGKVKHTGRAKLHKGERVLTKKQAKKYRK